MNGLPSEALLERYAPQRPVPWCRDILVHQAWSVYALWHAWERETRQDQGIPFWAAVWPGAVVLARYIEQSFPVAGKRVLDLGCGGGVAAISAARAGAREVIANDIDPIAIAMAHRNARANQVHLRFETHDLTQSDLFAAPDVVLAGDLFYEKSSRGPLLRFLRRARQNGALVLIADGSRPFAPRRDVRTLLKRRVPVDLDLEGADERTVRLMEFR